MWNPKIKYNLIFLSVFILTLFSFGNYLLFATDARGAEQGSMTVQAMVPGCGNSVIDAGEACDNGGNNGACPLVCSAACTLNNCRGGGAGGGGGDLPPTISNVVATVLGAASAKIAWTSGDDHDGFNVKLVYGLTENYGTAAYDGQTNGTNVVLNNLLPNAKYFFKFTVTDSILQQVFNTGNFTTAAEGAGLVISNNQIKNITKVSANASWDTNVVARGQVVWGKTLQYGSTVSDNNLDQAKLLVLPNLIANTIYHYKIIATDADGNSVQTVDATFATLKNDLGPPDVSDFDLIVGMDNMSLSWVNPLLLNFPDFAGVKIIRKVGGSSADINDGILVYTGAGEKFVDNNVQKNVDYFYTIFSYNTSDKYSGGVFRNGKIVPLPPGVNPEMCDNGLDDDLDAAIDCADFDCVNFPACAGKPPVLPPLPPGGEPEPLNPPVANVPGFAKLQLSDLLFLGGNRKLTLTMQNNEVLNLVGGGASLGIPKGKLIGSFEKMIFVEENGAIHQFFYDSGSDTYFSDFIFSSVGAHPAYFSVDYGNGQVDTVQFVLRSLSLGRINGDDGASIGGVKITLKDSNDSDVSLSGFGENNPVITNDDGLFGWLAPNDQYFLILQKDGYFGRRVPIRAQNKIINFSLELNKIPLSPKLDLDTAESLGKVAVNVVSDYVSDPLVQSTISDVIAPVAVGAAIVGTVSLISWSGLLALLQFLFFQPILLLGRRKRQKWGLVYNTLTKLPIDLAVVRLVDNNGKIVQSRVTDTQGRYIFSAKPGTYKITVNKNQYVFPSELLKNEKNDGTKTDIYHGETISVTEESIVVAVNIPLDPISATIPPIRIKIVKALRGFQLILSWVGLIVTAISFYLSRQWYVGVLLIAHILVFLVFRKLAISKKPKGWGIVYDQNSKRPISNVIARLFDSRFNKMIATQITDQKGRYYFLAGGSQYYMTYNHRKYEELKTNVIKINEEGHLIALNVALKKNARK